MLVSHKCLWNCIELIESVKQSIRYLDEDCKCNKLLNYTIRLFERFAKFCEVYFDYKTYVVNRFNFDTAAELSNVCDFTSEIMKFVKVHVSIILRKNPRAQDIIKNICFKSHLQISKLFSRNRLLQQRNVQEKYFELAVIMVARIHVMN